jgi:menaquinone-dependent protoporphyrinogen IX oxidase
MMELYEKSIYYIQRNI